MLVVGVGDIAFSCLHHMVPLLLEEERAPGAPVLPLRICRERMPSFCGNKEKGMGMAISDLTLSLGSHSLFLSYIVTISQ